MERQGTVAEKGTYIQGSTRQEPWRDVWLAEHAINSDVELTDEVCDHIVHSFNQWQANNFKIIGGGLRTVQRPNALYVDREERVLIVEHSSMLCD